MYVALLALNVVLFALLTGFYLRSKVSSLYHPLSIYLAFHGIVFVLRPILSWYYGYQLIYKLYQFAPDAYVKSMALVAANIGLFSFAAASLRWGREPFRNRSDRFAAAELQALAKPLWITVLLLFPLIALSLRSYWKLRGVDVDTLVLDPATGTTINTAGNGYLQAAYCMGVALFPLIAWIGRFRWWSLIPAFVFAVAQAGSGLRSPIVSELLCLCGLFLYARGRKWFEPRTLVILLGAAFAFNAVGADRGESVRALLGEKPTVNLAEVQASAPLEGMDLGNLEFLEFLIDKIPRATGSYEYFVDNLQVFTEPIPRVLWKDKPVGQPIRFFYLFDYGFPIGMTRSLPGEGWTQLGLAGVAIWCGLWGAICGWIYSCYVRSGQSAIQTAYYMTFLAMLIVFYRDGLLTTMLRQGLFFLMPMLVWGLMAKLLGSARAADFRRLAASKFARRERLQAAAPALPGGAPEPVSAAGPARVLPRSLRHPRR